MDKRTLLAVVLAVMVIMAYSSMTQRFYPSSKEGVSQSAQTVSSTASQLEKTVSFSEKTVSFSNFTKLIDSAIIRVSTENVDYEFSNAGGCLKSINIKRYNGLEQKNGEMIYDSEYAQDAIFSISGLSIATDVSKARYDYLKRGDGVEFGLLLKEGLEIKKIYRAVGSNGLMLELRLVNVSAAPVKCRYNLVGVSNIKPLSLADARFVEAAISLNGKPAKVRPPRSINAQPAAYTGNIGWVALQNKYFSIVAKPYQQTASSTVSKSHNSNIYIELQNDTVEIQPAETVSHKFLLYAGPTNYDSMASYQAGIEGSVNFGVFGQISNLLLIALKFFYKISHNYGIAIILLAILISIVLYPLTLKSVKLMKGMQLLQPKIERLRKEYKDNPQKLNKEIMELYKKHKVNPFGGCLPMILQMPIFIALYQAFMRSIELKNARFLWIKDLSSPDKAFLLPFATASGGRLSVNILPILMAITMFFQQKLSSQGATVDKNDPMQQQQKMMGLLMPIFFGAIFYNMPSGLVLYWFLNTLIMVLQQIRVAKQFHVEHAVTG